MKFLYTFGVDCGFDENGEMQDKAYVIKIWDFTQLVSGSCKFLYSSKSLQTQLMADSQVELSGLEADNLNQLFQILKQKTIQDTFQSWKVINLM